MVWIVNLKVITMREKKKLIWVAGFSSDSVLFIFVLSQMGAQPLNSDRRLPDCLKCLNVFLKPLLANKMQNVEYPNSI